MAAPKDGNAIQAALLDLTYLGATTELALKTPGGTALSLSQPTASLPASLTPGAEVWVSWAADRGLFL